MMSSRSMLAVCQRRYTFLYFECLGLPLNNLLLCISHPPVVKSCSPCFLLWRLCGMLQCTLSISTTTATTALTLKMFVSAGSKLRHHTVVPSVFTCLCARSDKFLNQLFLEQISIRFVVRFLCLSFVCSFGGHFLLMVHGIFLEGLYFKNLPPH